MPFIRKTFHFTLGNGCGSTCKDCAVLEAVEDYLTAYAPEEQAAIYRFGTDDIKLTVTIEPVGEITRYTGPGITGNTLEDAELALSAERHLTYHSAPNCHP
jgi:hypothetical protein